MPMLKSAAVAAIALATGANAFSPSLTSLSGLCANKPGLSSQSSLAGRPAAISLCQHGRNCACDSCTGARRERSMTGLKMAATTNVMEGREAGRRLLASLKPDEVRELFDTFDVNNTGQLCESELKAAFRSKGVNMTEYEFMNFIKELDQNVDGYICLQDFQDAVTDMQRRLGFNGDSGAADGTIITGTQTVIRKAKENLFSKVAKETDSWRESSRRYKRTVFEAKDWVKYRRSTRLLDMVLTTLDSGVVRALWFDVGVVVTFCSFLLLWNHGVDDKVIVNFVNSVTDGSTDVGKAVQNIAAGLPGIKLPLSPFTLSSSSLGLLLVFRTNGAFQRFFEARVLWGAVVNYCRTMTRQGLYYLDDPKDIEELTRRTIAYCRAVKFHFRYDADKEMLAKKEFTELLGKEEAEKLLSATHRPCQAMADMTTFIRSCKLDPLAMQAFDRTLEQYSNQFGAMERIFKTPLPLVYTRHTARFLTLWCLLLPMGLYKDVGGSLALIPVCAVITAFKLGIEELGVQITEPFSVLPLENMCDGIENSCFEMVRRNTKTALEGPKYAGDDAKKIL